jgi:hypothetical protein
MRIGQPRHEWDTILSVTATFSLWHLKSLSYAPQQCHDLILSVQNALGQVDVEIAQELAKVQSTEFMVVVMYVR